MTIGEERVRKGFNPSHDERVNIIKELTAKLIDMCEEVKDKDGRAAAIAQTNYETACMYAVKAATAYP